MKRYLRYIWIISIYIPLSLLISWHYIDQNLPRNDAAAYLNLAQAIFFYGKQTSSIAALQLAYTFRDWKPILHPILAIPFFFISRGDVFICAKLYLIFCFSLFSILIHCISAELLPKIRAALLTFFICTIPWVFTDALSFNSEISFLTALAACFLFWIKADHYKHKWPSLFLGIFLALAFCIRPIEALFFCAGPILMQMAILVKYEKIKKSEPLFLLVYLLLCLGLLCMPIFFLKREYSLRELINIILFFTFISSIFTTASHKFSHFYKCFILAMLIATAWYLPGANHLGDWIYNGTIGDLARLVSKSQPIVYGEYLYNLFNYYNGYIILSLLLACLSAKRKYWKKIISYEGAGLCLSALLLPLIGFLRLNTELRYYQSSFLLIYFLLGYLALLNKFNPYRLFLLTLPILIQLIYLSNTLSLAHHKPEDPIRIAFDDIRDAIPSRGLVHIGVLGLGTPSKNCPDRIGDPWTIQLLARNNGLLWRIGKKYSEMGVVDSDQNADLKLKQNHLSQQYDYLYVGPVNGGPSLSMYKLDELTNSVLKAWRENKLQELKFKFLREVYDPNTPCTKYILLETL